MIRKIYYRLHRKFSKPEERGEYSAGRWQDLVRENVFNLCRLDGKKILEIGCGEGLFLSKIARTKKNVVVVGMDIWKDILIRARQRMQSEGHGRNIELIQADAVSLPFADNIFDSVVCINVFFNLPGEEHVIKSLKEISRVLKKEGNVFFDIRNSLNPLLYFKYKLARYYDETVKNLPLRTYNLRKIKLYLEESGFKIARKIEIGFPQNQIAPIIVIQAQRKNNG